MVDTINFQIVFPEAGTFKKILDTISGLMKDCIFNITPNGFFLDSIDETRICLISLSLPDTYFSSFRCNQATQISIRVASLVKLVKFCDNNDTITLSQRQSQTDQIEILVESSRYQQTMNFVLRLTRTEQEQLSADKVQPDSIVQLDAARFSTLCRDLQAIGSVVRLATSQSDGTVVFDVEGEESHASIAIASGKSDNDDEVDAKVVVKSDVDMKFTLRYFILFSKASSLSQSVRIELTTGNPAVVSYEFGQGGRIQFLLACSVEGEQEEAAADDANDDDV